MEDYNYWRLAHHQHAIVGSNSGGYGHQQSLDLKNHRHGQVGNLQPWLGR